MATIEQWNQYWKDNPNSKALFTDSNGENIKDFEAFWSQRLTFDTENLSVIDIACGAGALFQTLGSKRFRRKVGLDCSKDALESFLQNVPDGEVIHNERPYLSKEQVVEFDLILSQFGIEYLGVDAIMEMPNMMKQGAKFFALCHYKGGHIYSRYKREKEGMEILFSTNAFDNALQIATLINRDTSEFESKANDFMSYLSTMNEKWCAGSLHFVNGINQLFASYRQYEHSDIVGWIKGFKQQLETIYSRVSAICDVALSTDDIKKITSGKFHDNWSVDSFSIENSNLPVAWYLRYTKE